jgi:hypothetical protein
VFAASRRGKKMAEGRWLDDATGGKAYASRHTPVSDRVGRVVIWLAVGWTLFTAYLDTASIGPGWLMPAGWIALAVIWVTALAAERGVRNSP